MAARPAILVTNDDGFDAPGLWAAADALSSLGDVTISAPDTQWSGAGRSLPRQTSGKVRRLDRDYNGRRYTAYSVDGTPAQAALFGILRPGGRPPDLVVAGINNGENVSVGISVSGTIGAALEAAASGIKALAVSLEMPLENQHAGLPAAAYAAAAHFTRLFAARLLEGAPIPDVDVVKLDIPSDAEEDTPWRIARVSRTAYYIPCPPQASAPGDTAQIPYTIAFDPGRVEPDSDTFLLRTRRMVTVTPLSMDMTSRTDFSVLERFFRQEG